MIQHLVFRFFFLISILFCCVSCGESGENVHIDTDSLISTTSAEIKASESVKVETWTHTPTLQFNLALNAFEFVPTYTKYEKYENIEARSTGEDFFHLTRCDDPKAPSFCDYIYTINPDHFDEYIVPVLNSDDPFAAIIRGGTYGETRDLIGGARGLRWGWVKIEDSWLWYPLKLMGYDYYYNFFNHARLKRGGCRLYYMLHSFSTPVIRVNNLEEKWKTKAYNALLSEGTAGLSKLHERQELIGRRFAFSIWIQKNDLSKNNLIREPLDFIWEDFLFLIDIGEDKPGVFRISCGGYTSHWPERPLGLEGVPPDQLTIENLRGYFGGLMDIERL